MKRLRDYSDEELQYMPQEKVRIVFPGEGHEQAYLRVANPDGKAMSRREFQKKISDLGALRTCDCVAKFHVFPTSEEDVLENELLWSVVNQMDIDPAQTNRLLKKNVLVMSFPNALYEYLSICTPEEMKQTILDIVSDVVDHPDSVATGAMLENLAPSVFQDLSEYVSRRRTGEIEPLKQTFLLDDILGHKFDQFSSAKEVDLWNIDVRGGYLTDEDIQLMAKPTISETESCSSPEATTASRAFHRLYSDWCVYRDFGFGLNGRQERLHLMEAIVSNITHRKQEGIAERITSIRTCAKVRKSLLWTLPLNTVDEVVRNIAVETRPEPSALPAPYTGMDGAITRSNTIREFFVDDDNHGPQVSACSGCTHCDAPIIGCTELQPEDALHSLGVSS